jgi:hypothetical protein
MPYFTKQNKKFKKKLKKSTLYQKIVINLPCNKSIQHDYQDFRFQLPDQDRGN